MSGLVLSVFPGIGLLDMAFELEGFCVVRGPDLLWGGDVRSFHPPSGRFDGVIGGPPCQQFVPLAAVNRKRWGDDSIMPDMIPEFARVIAEARPSWWLMECSENAYAPKPAGFRVHEQVFDNHWLGESQGRRRLFAFGTRDGQPLHISAPALVPTHREVAVVSTGAACPERGIKRTLADMCELQGLPAGFADYFPFTHQAKRKAVANGVPIPMGRAIARAVVKALARGEVVA